MMREEGVGCTAAAELLCSFLCFAQIIWLISTMQLLLLLLFLSSFLCLLALQSDNSINFHSARINTDVQPRWHSDQRLKSNPHHYQLTSESNYYHNFIPNNPFSSSNELFDSSANNYQFFVLQCSPPLTPSFRAELEFILQQNLTHYIPNHSFVVYTTLHIIQQLEGQEKIQWIGLYHPEYKIHSTVNNAVRKYYRINHKNSAVDKHNPNPFKYSHQGPVVRPVTLDVYIGVSDFTYNPTHPIHKFLASALSEQFQLQLITMQIEGIQLHQESNDLIAVQFAHKRDIEIVSTYFSQQPAVRRVEVRPNFRAHNMWAKGIVQNDISSPDYVHQSGLLSWDHKLDGSTEVIGISDSGLDWQSCFFHDKNFPNGPDFTNFVQTNSGETPPGYFNPTAPTAHRKIIQYVGYADRADDLGHGTHTSCSIAGELLPEAALSLTQFNGMAPKAKLAFFDIGQGDTGALNPPYPLDLNLFPWAYAAGARVHSNSWGSDDAQASYSSPAQATDLFIWKNKDMLILFSAGNDGLNGGENGDGSQSITATCSAKNILCVGASVSPFTAWTNPYCSGGILSAVPNADLICSSAQANTPVYAESSIAYFSSRGPAADGRIKPDVVVPGQLIISALNAQNSTSSCSNSPQELLKFDQGTSMACPVLAGHVALVRQYLTQGYYPSGNPNPADSIKPSAALMKAIIIGAAISITGVRDLTGSIQNPKYTKVIPAPSYDEGFGRVLLKNSLQFFGGENRLLIYRPTAADGVKIDQYGDPLVSTTTDKLSFQFCYLKALNSGFPAKVVLTYSDYPADPNAETSLVNDLDLTLTDTKRRSHYLGNSDLPTSKTGEGDRLNNIEAVTIATDTPQLTDFTATVSVYQITYEQPFSLVVTGKVLKGPCTQTQPQTFQWQTGNWTTCSKPCKDEANTPTQNRTVVCVSSWLGVTADSDCATLHKPSAQQQCNAIACKSITYLWKHTEWNVCHAAGNVSQTVSCGGGVQERTVFCYSSLNTTVDDSKCPSIRPTDLTQLCNSDPCGSSGVGHAAWFVSDCLTECTAWCNGGQCQRNVYCALGDTKVEDSFCAGLKPSISGLCNIQACNSAAGSSNNLTYSWLVGAWTACSSLCGGGQQSRSVVCLSSMNTMDEDSKCRLTSKPTTLNYCNNDQCPPQDALSTSRANYVWLTGSFSSCNPLSRMQSRWVLCALTNAIRVSDESACVKSVGEKPAERVACTPTAISIYEWQAFPQYFWFTTPFSRPTVWCNALANGKPSTASRLVYCLAQNGLVASTRDKCVNPISGAGAQPPLSIIYSPANHPCYYAPLNYEGFWLPGEWNMCSNTNNPCQGVERRDYHCIHAKNGTILSNDHCSPMPLAYITIRSPCSLCSNAFLSVHISPFLLFSLASFLFSVLI
jgi:subtilisin family serine protease